MIVHVFSDSTLCVGVSNPDPSHKWATKLEDAWNEHGVVEKLNLVVREIQVARTTNCFFYGQQETYSEIPERQNPESFDEGIRENETCRIAIGRFYVSMI